jgi:hypothetical protein
VLPNARDAVLVKQVRLGQGGFILTVAPVDDDKSETERLVTLTAGTLWVPIIHPCWLGSMSVLVEGAAESVSSADVEVRDPPGIGDRFG